MQTIEGLADMPRSFMRPRSHHCPVLRLSNGDLRIARPVDAITRSQQLHGKIVTGYIPM
jgi:hypothetical protein